MRNVAQVFLAYFTLLIFASVWRLGWVPAVAPELTALFAAYLAITSSERVAPAALAAATIGYLGDLLLSTPPGLQATTAAGVCLVGHLVHKRILVRGLAMTVVFSLLTGVLAAGLGLPLRAYFDLLPPAGGWSSGWGTAAVTVLLTGIAGPLVFAMCAALDRRFVRAPHLQSPI